MKIVFVLGVIIIVVVVVVLIAYLAIDNARLRRRMAGIDEPELWLPRAERRAHARKLLKREDEEYEQMMIARLTEVIKSGNQPSLSLVEERKGKSQ